MQFVAYTYYINSVFELILENGTLKIYLYFIHIYISL